jgi:hypothetical protein
MYKVLRTIRRLYLNEPPINSWLLDRSRGLDGRDSILLIYKFCLSYMKVVLWHRVFAVTCAPFPHCRSGSIPIPT